MRLKKLKIFGFKSFADGVHLDFDADVIGLVGPNGCGKSNIVDAFRWVLGEQSAKSMRADKMYDVIFAGTHNRKPLGYAEVSLILSDVGALDEVVVARRLYRNGDSEYLINKDQVRLKDVQALFLGTGVGKNAFSIFEQGKLDAVINLSPFDRRSLFDEAAGIGKFLQNKKETLKHLEEVNLNYGRIQDLHNEIDKRRKQLKKQSADALLYQEKKHLLEWLDCAVQFAKWRKLEALAISSAGEREALKREILSEKESLLTVENHFGNVSEKIRKVDAGARQCDEEHYACSSLFKIKGSEEKREREKIADFEARKKKLESENQTLHIGRQPLLAERKTLVEELAKLELERKSYEMKVADKERSFRASDEELKKLREGEKVARREQMQFFEKRAHLEKELSKEKERLEQQVRELSKLEEALVENEKWILTCESEEKKHKERVLLELKEIEALKEELPQLNEKLKIHEQKISELEREITSTQKKIQECKAGEKVLRALQEEGEQGKGILLKKGLKPFYTAFVLPKGQEKVWSHFLKAYQATFVVKDEAEFEEVKKFASENKIHGYSIATESQLKKIESQKLQLCSEESFHDPFGVFFSLGQDENNAFTRQLKLEALGKALEEQEKYLEGVLKKSAGLKTEKMELEKKRAELDEKRRKSEMNHLQENFFLQQSSNDLKKAHIEKLRLAKEKDAKTVTEGEKKEFLEKLEMSLRQVQEFENGSREKLSNYESMLKSKVDAFEEVQSEKKQLELAFQKIVREHQRIEGSIRIIDAKEEERLEREKSLVEELQRVIAQKNKSEEKVCDLSSEVRAAQIALDESTEKQNKIKGELLLLKSELDEVDKHCLRQRKKLEALIAREQKFEVFFAENMAAKKPLAEDLKSRYSLEIEKLQESNYCLEKGLEESEKDLHRLRFDLEKGGLVNLAAIEESKVEEERFTEIDRQLKDMLATKEDIEKIIQRLDQESRKAFKATFEQVRANFQRNFSLFFNGGNADLRFTETQDVLEAGVEIFAEPPGKQMRTISLLSGGEKCMTALALLFSIFEVRPAPFCILDEVDAPLDDANVERFTHVLRQFTKATQFIIVTHNKKTMAITDCLFGVSMEEKGVSKLISILFEQNKKKVESVV